MDTTEVDTLAALLPISLNAFIQHRGPLPLTPKKDVNVSVHSPCPWKILVPNADGDVESCGVKRIDLNSLPELRVLVERIRTPMKSIETGINSLNLQCSTNDTTLPLDEEEPDDDYVITLESDEDSEDVGVVSNDSSNGNDFNATLPFDVESELESAETEITYPPTGLFPDDEAFSSDNDFGDAEDSEDVPVVIHGLSDIFVKLERIRLPDKYKYKSRDSDSDCQETDTIEDADDGLDNTIIEENCIYLNTPPPTPVVLLERLDISTITSFGNISSSEPEIDSSKLDLISPFPEPTVLLERIPDSVFKKYGLSAPKRNIYKFGRIGFRNREDNRMYCVLGLKLLFRKRKQEDLFEARVAELRDVIIPMRNEFNSQKKLKRQSSLSPTSFSKRAKYL